MLITNKPENVLWRRCSTSYGHRYFVDYRWRYSRSKARTLAAALLHVLRLAEVPASEALFVGDQQRRAGCEGRRSRSHELCGYNRPAD
jgi:FMN phosphatase YigB (HAD superfamily)